MLREELYYYNANTHSVSSGDCVKRAISLAFDLDYETVARLLRQKAKDYRYKNWNVTPVFTSVIKDLCNGKINTFKSDLTVGKFAEIYNKGTYIILCHNTNEYHLVCIIDGNVYDSWDSRKLTCTDVYIISQDTSEIFSYDSQKDKLKSFANDTLSKLITKYNFKYGALMVTDDSDFYTTDYAFSFTVIYSLKEIGYNHYNDLIEPMQFTFSPRRSLEENKKIVYKLCKTTITRLAKAVQRYIDEYEDVDEYEDLLEFDSANIYYKLPLWAQKLMISSWKTFSWAAGQDIYRVTFQPLKADPNQEHFCIDAITVTKVKQALERYKKTFQRPDIDYDCD